jgi:hypothetical protein
MIGDAGNTPESKDADAPSPVESEASPHPEATPAGVPEEIGGRPGPEPTRYGDWEKNGRCIDF